MYLSSNRIHVSKHFLTIYFYNRNRRCWGNNSFLTVGCCLRVVFAKISQDHCFLLHAGHWEIHGPCVAYLREMCMATTFNKQRENQTKSSLWILCIQRIELTKFLVNLVWSDSFYFLKSIFLMQVYFNNTLWCYLAIGSSVKSMRYLHSHCTER